MLGKLVAAAACLTSVSAHIALYDKGMFGKNYPAQDGDSTVYWNSDDAVTPLKEADGRSMNDWFAHGRKAYPPKAGDFMVLPAGGTYVGETACNRALTSLRNPQIKDPLPQYACPENTYGDGVGALHTQNRYGSTPQTKFFGGSALAIAYTSDANALQPNDLTVISVNYDSVWTREINFAIPAGLPPCPSGGCLCTWNWIHQGGGGEGYPFEIYNNLYRCTVTGQTDSSKKVQRGAVPKQCAGNSGACVSGPKTPMYIYQADGNNMAHVDTPPNYNAAYGFSNGAQNDIFAAASSPAPTSYMVNGWATPTGTNGLPAPTSTTLPSGWSAVGCNVDDPNTRALNRGSTSSSDMTIQKCTAYCASNGFIYAGVEYGQECWCGDALRLNLVDSSECNVPCAGDSLAKCGGSYRLSLFASNKSPTIPTSASKIVAAPFPTASLPSGWSDLGCTVDNGDKRALNRGSISQTDMTVQKCLAYCSSKGFPYAGVEYGVECFCGDASNPALTKASDGCNVPCGGDPGTICGGSYRLNVYSNRAVSSSSSTVSTTSTKAATSTSSTTTTTTVKSSTTTSSTTSTTVKPSTTTSTSTTPSPSPSATGTPGPAGWTDLGCMMDYNNPRTLNQGNTYMKFMTTEMCLADCASKGFPYAGTQFGVECWCGSGSPTLNPASSGCTTPCGGDKTKMCGGSYRLNVYKAASAGTGTTSSKSSTTATSTAVQVQTVTVTVTTTVSSCSAGATGRRRAMPMRFERV